MLHASTESVLEYQKWPLIALEGYSL